VIEVGERVMARAVSPELSRVFADAHRAQGVDLRLAAGVTGLTGDRAVTGVVLTDETTIPADLVVMGVGGAPNDDLARSAGLECPNGVAVDGGGRTAAKGVYACGDCAFGWNAFVGTSVRLESVQNAVDQAKAAARAMIADFAGDAAEDYAQTPTFWSDQYGLKLQMAGLAEPGDERVIREGPDGRRLVFHLRGGVVAAVEAVNAGADFMRAKRLVEARASIGPGALADPQIEIKTLAA